MPHESLGDDENDYRPPAEGLGPRILRRQPSPCFTIVAVSDEDAWRAVTGLHQPETRR